MQRMMGIPPIDGFGESERSPHSVRISHTTTKAFSPVLSAFSRSRTISDPYDRCYRTEARQPLRFPPFGSSREDFYAFRFAYMSLRIPQRFVLLDN